MDCRVVVFLAMTGEYGLPYQVFWLVEIAPAEPSCCRPCFLLAYRHLGTFVYLHLTRAFNLAFTLGFNIGHTQL